MLSAKLEKSYCTYCRGVVYDVEASLQAHAECINALPSCSRCQTIKGIIYPIRGLVNYKYKQLCLACITKELEQQLFGQPLKDFPKDTFLINEFKMRIDPIEQTMEIYSENPLLQNKLWNDSNICPIFYSHEMGQKYLEFLNTIKSGFLFVFDVKKEFRYWQYIPILLDYY